MELAQLNRERRESLLEQCPYTLPSVDCEGLEPESGCDQCIKTLPIVFDFLTRNFPPVEIPPVRTTDENAVGPMKEGCIHQEIHRLLCWDDFSGCSGICIEIFAESLWILLICFSEIVIDLFPFCIFLVCLPHPAMLLLVLPNENVLAVLALISLAA